MMGLTSDELNRIINRVFNPNEFEENSSDNESTSSVGTAEFYNNDNDTEDDQDPILNIAKIIYEQENFHPPQVNMVEQDQAQSRNLAEVEDVDKVEADMEELFYSPPPSPSHDDDVDNMDFEMSFHDPPAENQQIVETREILPVVSDDDDELEIVYEKINSTHVELDLPGVVKMEDCEIKITNVIGNCRPFKVYKIDPDEPDIESANSNEFAPPIREPVTVTTPVPVNVIPTEEIFQANQAVVENHGEQSKKTKDKNKTNQKTNFQEPQTAISTDTLLKIVTTNSTTTATDAQDPSPNSDKENKKKKKKPEKETPRDININISPNRIFKNKNQVANGQISADNQAQGSAQAQQNNQNQTNVHASNAAPVQEKAILDYSALMEKAKEFNELFIEFMNFLRNTRINTNSKYGELDEFYMLKGVYFIDLIKPTPFRFIQEKMNILTVKSIKHTRSSIYEDYNTISDFNPPAFDDFCGTIRECITEREEEIGESEFKRPTENMIKRICKILYNHLLKEMEVLRDLQEARILHIYKDQREKYPDGNYPLLDQRLAAIEKPTTTTEIIADPYEFQDEIEIPAEPEPTPEPEIARKSEKIILRKISTNDAPAIDSEIDDPTFTPNGSGNRKRKSSSNDGKIPPKNKRKNSEGQVYHCIPVITID